MDKYLLDQKLIVAIVKKGLATEIVKVAKQHGAEGSTIFYGSGTAKREIYENILRMNYEPEKEIILIGINQDLVDGVMEAISKKLKIKKPGNGIAFVLDVSKCIGIARLLREMKL